MGKIKCHLEDSLLTEVNDNRILLIRPPRCLLSSLKGISFYGRLRTWPQAHTDTPTKTMHSALSFGNSSSKYERYTLQLRSRDGRTIVCLSIQPVNKRVLNGVQIFSDRFLMSYFALIFKGFFQKHILSNLEYVFLLKILIWYHNKFLRWPIDPYLSCHISGILMNNVIACHYF
jgi:hypothetical protein